MDAPIRINLHCHSSSSDGSLSPERVAEAMAFAGVRVASLTDHDTTAGLERFESVLSRHGILFVTGVEITVAAAGESMHILAYGFDPENPDLQHLLAANRRTRAVQRAALGEKARRLGARLRSLMGRPPEIAFDQALPDAAEIIRLVHRAGGLAFLAHPLTLTHDFDPLDTWLAELKDSGLDGIETIYSAYARETREHLAALARRHELLVCGGTDFHGFHLAGLNRGSVEMPFDNWTAFREALTLPPAPPPVERQDTGEFEDDPAAPPDSAFVKAILDEAPIQGRVLRPAATPTRWGRFVLRIVFPTVLAIVLFLGMIFGVVVPTFEDNLLERKREMIRELTNSAWSILAESEAEARAGTLDEDEARHRAAERVGTLRYGKERKDYFWITDMHPRMIVHPYRSELEGADLSELTDMRGVRMFVEFAKMAARDGEGYVEYYWQWKDNPDRTVPKQSFVKRFEPWDWVVGTGIYLDDVKGEIRRLTRRLLAWCLGITGVIVGLMGYMTRESLRIEKRRSLAEDGLRESHEKYAALVNASTEGALMVLEEKFVYSNLTMRAMLGYAEAELGRATLDDLFAQREPEHDPDSQTPPDADIPPTRTAKPVETRIAEILESGIGTGRFEARMRRKDASTFDVVATVTRIAFAGKSGFILAVKDAGRRRRRARSGETNAPANATEGATTEHPDAGEDESTALTLLSVALRERQSGLETCDPRTPLREAAAILARHPGGALAVTTDGTPESEVLGLLDESDLIACAMAEALDGSRPVAEAMRAPVVSLPETATLLDALLLMRRRGVRHVAVRDTAGRVVGLVHPGDLLEFHDNLPLIVESEIRAAPSIREIVEVHARFPRVVRSLLTRGTMPRPLNRLATRLCDSVVERTLEMALARLGPPPARFCFLALGSEGREEQTLATDQDNALLYENLEGEAAGRAETYFAQLGEMACGWLEQAGYAPCKGEIMARNPKWCRPLADWERYFAEWITGPDPQALLEFNVFFDFRAVDGDESLARDLRDTVQRLMDECPPFFLHMAQNALHYKPPIGFFGQIVTESSGESPRTFNIKDAMMPVVNFARLYALQHGIEETNTFDRLHALHEHGAIKRSLFDEAVQAYVVLMRMRLEHQTREAAEGRDPGNFIDPKALTRMDESMLKEALSVVAMLRKKISYDYLGQA